LEGTSKTLVLNQDVLVNENLVNDGNDDTTSDGSKRVEDTKVDEKGKDS